MKRFPVVFAILAACAGPQVTVQSGADFSKVRRVAVVALRDARGAKGSGEAAAAAFQRALLAAGYEVVERGPAPAPGHEGPVDPDAAARLGRELGADALLVGAVAAWSASRERPVVLTIDDVDREPIVRHEVRRQRKVTAGRREEWTTTEGDVVTGYRTVHRTRQEPALARDPGRAAASVRLIEAATGRVLWSARGDEKGASAEDAAETLARRVLKAVKKTWPAPK